MSPSMNGLEGFEPRPCRWGNSGKTLDFPCFLGHSARLDSGRFIRHFGIVRRVGHLCTAVLARAKLSLIARVHLQRSVEAAWLQLIEGSPDVAALGEPTWHRADGEVLG